MIIGGSGSWKTNKLLNLIKEQDYHDVIDNIYLHARDLNEPNTMDDVYEDIDKYNPKKDKKFWIVFDDMIADILTNRKF